MKNPNLDGNWLKKMPVENALFKKCSNEANGCFWGKVYLRMFQKVEMLKSGEICPKIFPKRCFLKK
jgi:hypothetical protein